MIIKHWLVAILTDVANVAFWLAFAFAVVMLWLS